MTLPDVTLIEMYWYMLLARQLDEYAWKLHRQGKIPFHISGIGHEAIQVGAAYAIKPGYDWVAPYYRDLALMLVLGLEPRSFALSLKGKKGDPASDGRQMPGHWSLKRVNVLSHSSVIAAQTPQAVGVAVGIKLRGEDKVVLHTTGEGATAMGEWYESVNWAAIHKLPVVFLVENNQYAISMRQESQMGVENAAEKAMGLGLAGVTVDGSDFTAVQRAVAEAVFRARNGNGPTLVEARTYRITPHSSDDDDRNYRPKKEVEAYRNRDPLLVARTFLESEDILDPERNSQMEARAVEIAEDAMRFALEAPYPAPDEALGPVYASGDEICLP